MGASNLNKMAEEQPQRNDVAKFALEMAKIAEQAERYEDMVAEMKKIVDDGVKVDELSVEERNLISVGYKNMMSVRRTAWRTIQQVEEEEARKNSTPGAAENLAAYKQNIASRCSTSSTRCVRTSSRFTPTNQAPSRPPRRR